MSDEGQFLKINWKKGMWEKCTVSCEGAVSCEGTVSLGKPGIYAHEDSKFVKKFVNRCHWWRKK